jgi:hypothetical protein
MANLWVRRRGDALAQWHMVPRGAKSPRGVLLAGCGLSLADDADKLERGLHQSGGLVVVGSNPAAPTTS